MFPTETQPPLAPSLCCLETATPKGRNIAPLAAELKQLPSCRQSLVFHTPDEQHLIRKNVRPQSLRPRHPLPYKPTRLNSLGPRRQYGNEDHSRENCLAADQPEKRTDWPDGEATGCRRDSGRLPLAAANPGLQRRQHTQDTSCTTVIPPGTNAQPITLTHFPNHTRRLLS
jgi:hypothetical protein